MEARVSRFRDARHGAPEAGPDSPFDSRVARRYVHGRVLELGLDKEFDRTPSYAPYRGRSRPAVERLGKKYQWMALHELLGFLADHYQYAESHDSVTKLRSASQLTLPDLEDPILPDGTHAGGDDEWGIAQHTPWWKRASHPFPCRMLMPERQRRLESRWTEEPSRLLCLENSGDQWVTLSGNWEWEEPSPCWFTDSSCDSSARLLWMANSYAVPDARLQRFCRCMRAPTLRFGMIEENPSIEDELNLLADFPGPLPRFEQLCLDTYSGVPGAWFTTANYSHRGEALRIEGASIPSPQLARLASLQWSRHGLDFNTEFEDRSSFVNMRHGSSHSTMMHAAKLRNALAGAGLHLVWRLFGWKWCAGSHDRDSPQREYWVVYCLDDKGRPKRMGGGTWLNGPVRKSQPLPWRS